MYFMSFQWNLDEKMKRMDPQRVRSGSAPATTCQPIISDAAVRSRPIPGQVIGTVTQQSGTSPVIHTGHIQQVNINLTCTLFPKRNATLIFRFLMVILDQGSDPGPYPPRKGNTLSKNIKCSPAAR